MKDARSRVLALAVAVTAALLVGSLAIAMGSASSRLGHTVPTIVSDRSVAVAPSVVDALLTAEGPATGDSSAAVESAPGTAEAAPTRVGQPATAGVRVMSAAVDAGSGGATRGTDDDHDESREVVRPRVRDEDDEHDDDPETPERH